MAVQKEQIIFEGKSEDLEKSLKNIQRGLSGLDKKLDKTSKNTKAATDKMTGSFSRMSSAIKGAIGVIGLASLGALAKDAISASDAIDKTSKKLGINAKALQELNFAASQNSVSTEKFADILKAIQNRSTQAKNGLNEYRKNFIKLGIDVNEFSKLPLEEKFKLIAERLKGIKDPAEKVAITMSLLGDSGKDALTIMENGAAGIEDYAAKAHQAGIILDDSVIKKNVELGDTLDVLTKRLKTAFGKLLAFVSPVINAILDGFDLMVNGLKIIGDAILASVVFVLELATKGMEKFFLQIEKIPFIGEKFKGASASVINFGKDLKSVREGAINDIKEIATSSNRVSASIDENSAASKKLAENLKNVVKPQSELTAEFKKGASAAEKLASDKKVLAEDGRKLADVLLNNTSPALEAFNKKIIKLKAALDSGVISQEEFSKASKILKQDFDKLNTAAGRKMANLQELAKSTAQEMQSNFENGFFNAMQGKFDGLLDSFVQTIDRMVAKALAADLANALGFGSGGGGGTNFLSGILGGGGGGGIGGIVSGIGSAIGGFFGGGKAVGGEVSAGRPILVGERGPEIFRPQTAGTIIPNGGGKSVVINMHISTPNADSFRKSQSQLIAEATAAANAANGRDL